MMLLENQGRVGEHLATHSHFLLPAQPSGEFSFHRPSLFLAHCGELTGVRPHSGWGWVCFSHPTLLRGRTETLECGGDRRARKTKKPSFSLDVQPRSLSNLPRQSCASGSNADSKFFFPSASLSLWPHHMVGIQNCISLNYHSQPPSAMENGDQLNI